MIEGLTNGQYLILHHRLYDQFYIFDSITETTDQNASL